jgi:glycosyltransferase involved in cell wall biosynthesis
MSLAKGLAGEGRDDGSPSVEVTVVTTTLAGGFEDKSLPFRLVRRPSVPELVHLIRAADIIHVAGPSFLPMLLGVLLRKAIVVEHHGFQTICPNGQLFHEPTRMPCPGHFMASHYRECVRCNSKEGLFKSLKMLLLTFPRRWLCKTVDTNIMPTNWLGLVLQLPRMKTIHHGIRADSSSSGLPTPLSPPAFAFVGRLVSTKGAHILLQAAHRLKSKGLSFRLKIVGEGPERRRLEEQVRLLGLGDSVEFLGYTPEEKVDEVLAGVTAVVMPSLGGEVFGMVALESMRRGILPVVSDLGALVEVTGNVGLISPPGDRDALAWRLEQVLKSPELGTTLGHRARERATKSFSESRTIRQHLAMYQELLEHRGIRC